MNNNERSTVDFSGMMVPELKDKAKSLGIKGYSTMKRADLLAALDAHTKAAENQPSFIDTLKASFAVNREVRSAKGRKAGKNADVTAPKSPASKALAYKLQRGSESAKMTARQARRVRKTENAFSF